MIPLRAGPCRRLDARRHGCADFQFRDPGGDISRLQREVRALRREIENGRSEAAAAVSAMSVLTRAASQPQAVRECAGNAREIREHW